MKFSSFHIFYRYDKPEIKQWAKQVRNQLAAFEEDPDNPDLVIVLGGDGAILEAARIFRDSILIGFNFGTKGFLATAHTDQDHNESLNKLKSGEFHISERTMVDVSVVRQGETVFTCSGLNEAVVSSLIGVAHLSIMVDGEHYQSVHGTGVLVATATGSTAYNLSAYGPIVVPELPALIVTELLDHDIPTPSLVLRSNQKVSIVVNEFRKIGRLKITETDEPADIVVDIDGANLYSLQSGDVVEITQSSQHTKLVEFEHGDFLKNIRDRFTFN